MPDSDLIAKMATLERLVQGLVADRKVLSEAIGRMIEFSHKHATHPLARVIAMREMGTTALSKLAVPLCFDLAPEKDGDDA